MVLTAVEAEDADVSRFSEPLSAMFGYGAGFGGLVEDEETCFPLLCLRSGGGAGCLSWLVSSLARIRFRCDEDALSVLE